MGPGGDLFDATAVEIDQKCTRKGGTAVVYLLFCALLWCYIKQPGAGSL